MLCAMDASYQGNSARAAAVVFRDWPVEFSTRELSCGVEAVAPYEPGAFFRRELPCLVRLLERLPALPTLMIADGYVWLDTEGRAGLGAHLYEHLSREISMVGVAKSAILDAERPPRIRWPAGELAGGTAADER